MRCRVGAVVVLALGGCGAEAADLFLVERAGTIPGARLTLRVTDDGRVSCNGSALVDIPSRELIAAREIARDLAPLALARRTLGPGTGPASILRYRVRTKDGAVAWNDTSPRQLPVLFRLGKLTRDLARGPCGLSR